MNSSEALTTSLDLAVKNTQTLVSSCLTSSVPIRSVGKEGEREDMTEKEREGEEEKKKKKEEEEKEGEEEGEKEEEERKGGGEGEGGGGPIPWNL